MDPFQRSRFRGGGSGSLGERHHEDGVTAHRPGIHSTGCLYMAMVLRKKGELRGGHTSLTLSRRSKLLPVRLDVIQCITDRTESAGDASPEDH